MAGGRLLRQVVCPASVGAGAAGAAAQLAVGFGLGQQMMQHVSAGVPDLLSPAEAAHALGVSESDVMAVLEAGELKGKKSGTTWRIPRAALTSYMSQ